MSQIIYNILLADDDPDDRLFFKDALDETKISTNIKTLNDGVQLMNYLNEPQIVLPHIVFLDLNMPAKSGLDCLKEIRNNSRLKGLTVAIYSTSSSEEDIENTFVEGANIYIKKPNSFTELKKVLSEVINLDWQYHTSGLNKETFLLNI